MLIWDIEVSPVFTISDFGGLGKIALTAVPPTCEFGPKPTELKALTLTSTGEPSARLYGDD